MSEERVLDYIKTCIRKGTQPGSYRAMGQALGMHPDAVSECVSGLRTDNSVIVERHESKPNTYRIPGVSPGEWPPEETGLSKLDPYMTRAEYQHKIHETQKQMRELFLDGWTFEEIQELVPNFVDEGKWSYYSVVQTITGATDPRIQQFLKERWPTAR